MGKYMDKIASVLQLAKWKPGDRVYFVISHGKNPNQQLLSEGNEWAFSESVHPKTLYKYNILKGHWNKKRQLPKLHATDFQTVMDILTTKYVVEPFDVGAVIRCPNTGEFVYCEEDEITWMPESNLFQTKAAATKERDRVVKMIKEWSTSD